MRTLLFWGLCSWVLPAAELEFESNAVDLFPAPGVASATATFPCRNTGAAVVRLSLAEGGCSCLGWKVLVDGRPTDSIPPGAAAVVLLDVSVVGGSQGRQWKSATFAAAGGSGSERHTLRFSYDTGSIIQLARKCLYWDIGERVAPQVSEFVVRAEERPIRITGLKSKNADFSVALETVEDGRRYRIRATPRTSAGELIGSVQVETDSTYEAWRSFSIFLLVTKVQH